MFRVYDPSVVRMLDVTDMAEQAMESGASAYQIAVMADYCACYMTARHRYERYGNTRDAWDWALAAGDKVEALRELGILPTLLG